MLKEVCRGRFGEELVFLDPRTGRGYTQNKLNEVWNAACEKAGVSIKLYNATKHSHATNLALDGVDGRTIQNLLGHADPRSTDVYIGGDLLGQKKAYERQGSIKELRPRTGPNTKKR